MPVIDLHNLVWTTIRTGTGSWTSKLVEFLNVYHGILDGYIIGFYFFLNAFFQSIKSSPLQRPFSTKVFWMTYYTLPECRCSLEMVFPLIMTAKYEQHWMLFLDRRKRKQGTSFKISGFDTYRLFSIRLYKRSDELGRTYRRIHFQWYKKKQFKIWGMSTIHCRGCNYPLKIE